MSTIKKSYIQDHPGKKNAITFKKKHSDQPFFQPKRMIAPVDDVYEREADTMADKTVNRSVRMTTEGAPNISPVPLQRKCSACQEGEQLQRKEKTDEQPTEAPSIVGKVIKSEGRSLDEDTRSLMESRMGYDFSKVKIHTGSAAAKSAQSINALAYTTGNSIVFNKGKYSPHTARGARLLAHELTHVVQQSKGEGHVIQRENVCDDPDYCTPFATAAEAASEEAWLRDYWLPLEEGKYGTEVHDLWESFLNRAPGSSLTPVQFSDPANPIVDSFTNSWAIADDQDEILEMVSNRLNRLWFTLRPYTTTIVSLSNFLSSSEMNNRPVNFSNPFSIAGHIAGGIGSSDAGNDYRNIIQGNVTLQKTPLIGSAYYISISTTLKYEIFDALDFCPGQCGSPAEQIFTIPLSRLEAGGQAYDVPYKVAFFAPSRNTRKFFA